MYFPHILVKNIFIITLLPYKVIKIVLYKILCCNLFFETDIQYLQIILQLYTMIW